MESILKNEHPTKRQLYLNPQTKIFLCITVTLITLMDGNSITLKGLHVLVATVPILFFIAMGKLHVALYYGLLYAFSMTVPYWIAPHVPSIVNLLFRGKNFKEDQNLARELQSSRKDLTEHKFVVEDIVKRLSSICEGISFSKRPELIQTEQLWHLSTEIEGKLATNDYTVFDAALAIHPTPAICGVPQAEAYKKIKQLEGNGRGLFTGIIGWCDENGDGDWAIAIRGAIIDRKSIFVRAGAGIVLESIAEEELRETGIKFRTMLKGINMNE